MDHQSIIAFGRMSFDDLILGSVACSLIVAALIVVSRAYEHALWWSFVRYLKRLKKK